MSTTAVAPAPVTDRRDRPPGRVTQARVARAEATKLWSLRSTRWSLLTAFVAMGGLALIIAAAQMSRWSRLDGHERRT